MLMEYFMHINQILAGYRPPFIYDGFQEYINKLGFSLGEVAKLTHRTIRTITHWISTDAPRWAYYYLYVCAGYVLNKNFHGFRFVNDELYTGTRITYNHGFIPAHLTEYTFFHDYQHTLERTVKKLTKELEYYKLIGVNNA